MQDDESFKSNYSTVLLVPSWWSFDEWQKLHQAERFRGRHDCKNCQTSRFGSSMTANNCNVAQWSSNRNNGQTPRQMSLLLNNDHSWISHADVTAPSSESTGCHWRCQWWHADFGFGEFGCESQLWEDLVAGCLMMEQIAEVCWVINGKPWDHGM